MIRKLRTTAMKQQPCAPGRPGVACTDTADGWERPMHEYLLHDLARATLAERRRTGPEHHHLARLPRGRKGAPTSRRVARVLAHLRLRPVEPPRRPEPAGA
jgi:hypothetical protein